MTDDIVTRLRKWARRIESWQFESDTTSELREAADEIERLRTDRDRWKNVAELAMQAHLDDRWTHVYEAYEWAVRGD